MAGGVWEDVAAPAGALERRAGVRAPGAQAATATCALVRLSDRGAATTAAAPTSRGCRSCPIRRPRRCGARGPRSIPRPRRSSASRTGDRDRGRDRGRHGRGCRRTSTPACARTWSRSRSARATPRTGATRSGRGVNALALLPPAQDAASGAVAYLSAQGHACAKPRPTIGSRHAARRIDQHDREVAQIIPVAALIVAAARGGRRCAAGRRRTPRLDACGGRTMRLGPSQTRLGKLHRAARCATPGRRSPRTRSARPSRRSIARPRRIPVDQRACYAAREASLGDGDRPRTRCTGCSGVRRRLPAPRTTCRRWAPS